MACQIMTVSDLQDHSPIASNFLYSYTAVGKISTDLDRRTVSLQ